MKVLDASSWGKGGGGVPSVPQTVDVWYLCIQREGHALTLDELPFAALLLSEALCGQGDQATSAA